MDYLTQYGSLCFGAGLAIGSFILYPLSFIFKKANKEMRIINKGLVLVKYEMNKERKMMTDREGNIVIFYSLENVWEYRNRQGYEDGCYYVLSLKAYNIVKEWDEEQFKSWASARYDRNRVDYVIYDIPRDEQLRVRMIKWPFIS